VWAYLKVVSSLTLLHYLWRLLGPFNLACETNVAVKYKSSIISQHTDLIDGIYEERSESIEYSCGLLH